MNKSCILKKEEEKEFFELNRLKTNCYKTEEFALNNHYLWQKVHVFQLGTSLQSQTNLTATYYSPRIAGCDCEKQLTEVEVLNIHFVKISVDPQAYIGSSRKISKKIQLGLDWLETHPHKLTPPFLFLLPTIQIEMMCWTNWTESSTRMKRFLLATIWKWTCWACLCAQWVDEKLLLLKEANCLRLFCRHGKRSQSLHWKAPKANVSPKLLLYVKYFEWKKWESSSV